MTDNNFYWLIGILEGEGSFLKPAPSKTNQPGIALQMCDEDVVKRVADMFNMKYHKSYTQKHIDNNWRPVYGFLLRGKRAVDLMKSIYPHMSIRRKKQIDNAIEGYRERITKKSVIDLNRIKELRDNKVKWRDIELEYGMCRRYIVRLLSNSDK